MFDLTGRRALVVGADDDLGRTLRQGLIGAGADVIAGEAAIEAEAIMDDLGEVDVLISHLGDRGQRLTSGDDEIRTMPAMVHVVACGMAERGCGKIVNFASAGTCTGDIQPARRESSRSAVAKMTREMCDVWGTVGVSVNGLVFAPGLTGRRDRAIGGISSWVAGGIPSRRPVVADDLVGTLVWLAAPASDFVHGQVITVDDRWGSIN